MVAAAARMLPFFVLGMLSGAIADRWSRRALLRVGTLAVSAVALLMGLMLLQGFVNVWALIALVTALGSMLAFTITIRQAFTYDIVGSGLALNGLALAAMAMQGGGIIGSLVSGAMIDLVGPGWQFIASAAFYAISAGATLLIDNEGRSLRASSESVLANLTSYARLVRQYPILLMLMFLTATTEVLGFTHMTLFPVFAKDVLHVGPTGLGVMTAGRQGGRAAGPVDPGRAGHGAEEGDHDPRNGPGIRRRADGVLAVGEHLHLHGGAAVRQRPAPWPLTRCTRR